MKCAGGLCNMAVFSINAPGTRGMRYGGNAREVRTSVVPNIKEKSVCGTHEPLREMLKK